MKIQIILGISLLLILVSCVPQVADQQKSCDASYSFVNGACCLDKDQNKICDKDEVQRAQNVIDKNPVIIIDEACSLPRFTCVSKEITPNYVKLVLHFDRDENIQVQKISLTSIGCSKEFNNTAMRFNEDAEFVIPCIIEGEGIDTLVATDVVIQPIVRQSNGQIFDYGTPTPATLNGHISGVVR